MIEAAISGAISLVIFAVGYGRLMEKISALEHAKIEAEKKIDGINAINISLAEMKKDIHYIKKKLDGGDDD